VLKKDDGIIWKILIGNIENNLTMVSVHGGYDPNGSQHRIE